MTKELRRRKNNHETINHLDHTLYRSPVLRNPGRPYDPAGLGASDKVNLTIGGKMVQPMKENWFDKIMDETTCSICKGEGCRKCNHEGNLRGMLAALKEQAAYNRSVLREIEMNDPIEFRKREIAFEEKMRKGAMKQEGKTKKWWQIFKSKEKP